MGSPEVDSLSIGTSLSMLKVAQNFNLWTILRKYSTEQQNLSDLRFAQKLSDFSTVLPLSYPPPPPRHTHTHTQTRGWGGGRQGSDWAELFTLSSGTTKQTTNLFICSRVIKKEESQGVRRVSQPASH